MHNISLFYKLFINFYLTTYKYSQTISSYLSIQMIIHFSNSFSFKKSSSSTHFKNPSLKISRISNPLLLFATSKFSSPISLNKKKKRYQNIFSSTSLSFLLISKISSTTSPPTLGDKCQLPISPISILTLEISNSSPRQKKEGGRGGKNSRDERPSPSITDRGTMK